MRRIFISYAQTSAEFRAGVLATVSALREKGHQVVIDADVASPQGPLEGWPRWMRRQIELADCVIVVCNDVYYHRFRGEEAPGTGLGARWEGAIIEQALYEAGMENHKFVPVLIGDVSESCIPEALRGSTFFRLPDELANLAAALDHPNEAPGVQVANRGGASAKTRYRTAQVLAFIAVMIAALAAAILAQRQTNFPLSVYVHGPAGMHDLILRNRGAVLLDLGTERRRSAIRENGEAIFSEIPASFRGADVHVILDARGFEVIDARRTHRLAGSRLYLPVTRAPATIIGHVGNDRGEPVAGAVVSIAGISQAADRTGRFSIVIPGERIGRELPVTVVADGHSPWRGTVVPGGGDVGILLPVRR